MCRTTIAKRDGFMLAGQANINTFDTYRRVVVVVMDRTILGVVTIEHVECYHKFRGKIEEKNKMSKMYRRSINFR